MFSSHSTSEIAAHPKDCHMCYSTYCKCKSHSNLLKQPVEHTNCNL